MAAYVDRFNAIQSDVKVEISYQDTPAQAVLDGVRADAGDRGMAVHARGHGPLDALGDIVKPGKIDPAWFYRGLLAMGSRDNRPFLIPISFTLPAIVYVRASQDLPNMFMPLDVLQSMSETFNKTSKNGSITAAGFSSLSDWNADFLTTAALLFGARFGPAADGLPAWDENGLGKTVDFVQKWMAGVNGERRRGRRLFPPHLVQPWYKLLSSGKTLFALASFTDFFALPEEERQGFRFPLALPRTPWFPSWTTCSSPACCALRATREEPAHSSSGFAASPVQQCLLTVNQSRRIGVFGVTNGFSALKSINEKDLPQKYPLLLGHVPQENFLAFPETLPDNWVKIRDGVIEPWIVQKAAGQEIARPSTKCSTTGSRRRRNRQHGRTRSASKPTFSFDISHVLSYDRRIR